MPNNRFELSDLLILTNNDFSYPTVCSPLLRDAARHGVVELADDTSSREHAFLSWK